MLVSSLVSMFRFLTIRLFMLLLVVLLKCLAFNILMVLVLALKNEEWSFLRSTASWIVFVVAAFVRILAISSMRSPVLDFQTQCFGLLFNVLLLSTLTFEMIFSLISNRCSKKMGENLKSKLGYFLTGYFCLTELILAEKAAFA